MNPPHLLLIKPRWMSRQVLSTRVEHVRNADPGAALHLLSEAPPDVKDLTWIELPDLWRAPRKEVLRTAATIRRRRYDRVLILTDPHGGDLGGRELRFWAFVARAREKSFEDGQPIRFFDSTLARLLAGALIRSTLRLAAFVSPARKRPNCCRRQSLLETRLYLSAYCNRFGEVGGRYLDIECGSGYRLEAASRQGWTVLGASSSDVQVGKCRALGLDVISVSSLMSKGTSAFRLITMFEPESAVRGPAPTLADLAGLLAPDGVLITRLSEPLEPELTRFTRDAAKVGLHTRVDEFSLAGAGCHDVWLFHERTS